MKKTIGLFLLAASLFFSSSSAQDPAEYTLVINSAVNPLLTSDFVNKTIQTVRKTLEPAKLIVKFEELPALEKAIEDHQADFFISTSATLRRYQDYGAKDILTAASPFSKNPNRSEGSLLIVKAGREDLNEISDLEGKKAAAGRPTAFGMYLAAMGEIAEQGFDPRTFFSSTKFYGLERDRIIKDVLNGEVDVGILRACYLEDAVNRKVVEANELKFINLKNDPEHVCLHSTELYPNWSLGSMPEVPPAVVSSVAAALIAQEPTKLGIYWSVASDLTRVDKLLKNLSLGPYNRFSSEWFMRLVFTYRYWLAGIFFAVLLLLMHSLLVTRTVNIRTAELKASLKRENEAFKRAEQANRRLLTMQRAGVVGQISSLIAHELNQPLTGIKLYARALQRAEETGKLTPEKLKEVLSEIRADADLAASIVARVRSYAKGQNVRREVADIGELAAKSVIEFQRQTGEKIPVELHKEKRCFAEIIPLEIELAVINILRNAAQAMQESEQTKPKIRVSVEKRKDFVEIAVEDNGSIDQETIRMLREPIESKKTEGLGLGLQIVKNIVQSHFGKIHFEVSQFGGLRVEIQLTAEKEEKNE